MELTEGFYVAVNVTAVVLTLFALYDAIVSRRVVRTLNGRAREIVADATVRREWFRLAVQLLLLSLAVPAVLKPGDTPLSFAVVCLLLIPVLLLASSIFDARDRRRVIHIIAAAAANEHGAS